jgi:S-adenosylmethionine/arginine decarboxylase-like enzyme
MDQEQAHFWEFPGGEENSEAPLAHMKGVSALQFIKTSSIVVHTVDELKKIYINIFSCKDFDADLTVNFTASFFDGTVKQQKILQRS